MADDGSVWSWGYNICILYKGSIFIFSAISKVTKFSYQFFLRISYLLSLFFCTYFLDFEMDGQLGFDGENSAKPCLLEQFLNTSSPDSSTHDSEIKSKTANRV